MPLRTSPLNQHLTDNDKEFKFGYVDGEYGYYKREGGADTFSPFSKSITFTVRANNSHNTQAFGYFTLANTHTFNTLTVNTYYNQGATIAINGATTSVSVNVPVDIKGKSVSITCNATLNNQNNGAQVTLA